MLNPKQHNIKKVLITGGTGFIGSNLAEALLNRGCDVKILRRKNSDLRAVEGLDVEHLIGSLDNISSLRNALKNCDTVFHTAAVVAMWKGKREEQINTNIQGTKNILTAASESGVEKFVHTSSIAALGYKKDGDFSDEQTDFNWPENLTYKYSKHVAEQNVMQAIENGLPGVVVNPAIVIGQKDYRFHGGALIKRINSGFIPFYIPGGINIAYIDDVVQGHISAAEKGRVGERYILGGTNLTIKEAFDSIAKVIGARSPKIKAPENILKFVAKLFDFYSTLTGTKPPISSDLIASMGINFWFSSEKAIKELDYKITPFETAVQKTYEWYKDEGLM